MVKARTTRTERFEEIFDKVFEPLQRYLHRRMPADSVDDGEPHLEAALEQLSDQERELLHLWAWEQLEPREIALVLESTPNAISLRLARAKQKLANSLERQSRPASGHSPDKQVPESSVGEM